jgi:hypothetical protein
MHFSAAAYMYAATCAGSWSLTALYARHGSERYLIRECASTNHVAATIAPSHLYRRISPYIDSPHLPIRLLSPDLDSETSISDLRLHGSCSFYPMQTAPHGETGGSCFLWYRRAGLASRFQSHIGSVEDTCRRVGKRGADMNALHCAVFK